MKKVTVLLLTIFLTFTAFAKESVIMLRSNGGLRIDKGNGGVEWAVGIPAGTTLELESSKIETKTLITTSEKYDNIDFYKVTYLKNSYYVRVSEVAKGDCGVILKDTLLYKNPALSSFYNTNLEQGTIIVLGEKTTKNSVDFQKIYYYSDSAGLLRTRYVLSKYVTSNKKDVEAIQLADKAVSITNDDDSRNKFFENAKKAASSSEILEYINNLQNK